MIACCVLRLRPSLIRVESDETAYDLHVLPRFELERALINGQLEVSDVPDAWNARFEELLGITVPDDAHGCLQDPHWAIGFIGYFPTYTLGNIRAAQLITAARRAIPPLSRQ